ncbi:MAG: ribulose-phosphate 3-epimerase [Lachnospiraceae bacterium]|nr:ribulose-phosphate 3-epimerase [Lachnospiraceae bacterium]
MIKLSPSLLSADFSKLDREIALVENAGAAYLHLDIMDGNFVPNITFGAPVIKKLRPVSGMIFDTHLMISDPVKYIPDFVKAGADIINFHAEAVNNPKEVIDIIRGFGVKAAVTIKPYTPVEEIEELLPYVDMVLAMTVEPGFGGQKLIAPALDNLRKLRRIRLEKGLSFEIEVDGGVTLSNVREVIEAGADVIVAGSAVFSAEDVGAACKEFLKIFEEYDI